MLFGLALREKHVQPQIAEQILNRVNLCMSSHSFLPGSDKKDWLKVQTSIRDLVKDVFGCFIWHKYESGRFILLDIVLREKALELILDFDCSERSPGRTKSFADKLEDNSQAAIALARSLAAGKILITAARTDAGKTRLIFEHK